MPKINIVTQLICFFTFAVLLNLLGLRSLLAVALVLVFALSFTKSHQFYRLTKRLKWVYLVMLLIFAFNTPGEYVASWSLAINPTYEGLLAGFTQVMRILVMLAALSLLLAHNTRPQLISGFYIMLSPLKYLNLDVERFAARLWLTLHYVETQQQVPKRAQLLTKLSQSLAEIFNETQHDDVTISLEKPVFTYLDYGLMFLITLIFIQVLFKVLA